MVVQTTELRECNIPPSVFFRRKEVVGWMQKVQTGKASVTILSGTHGFDWRYELEEDVEP